MIPKNYVPYHIHTQLSNGITNIDSITDFHDYIDMADSLGIKSFAFSEHGSLFAWLKKKEYIESKGMKYIHAVEAYLTEDDGSRHLYSADDILYTEILKSQEKKLKNTLKLTFEEYWQREDGMWVANVKSTNDGEFKVLPIDINTLKIESTIKTRDNYHVVLIAKNYDGVKELNKIISKSFCRNDFHYHYVPRITFEELSNTSDNIIVTTACLGGVLHKGTITAKEKFLTFLEQNKNRCFLEIQHHNCKEQIEYNQLIYQIHKDSGIPLIAGTDTHALNNEHMDGRAMLQKAKGIYFSDEETWDLTFKSIDELILAYKKQNSLPMDCIYEAINNTNVMADMVEEFTLNYSAKYPKLYSNSEEIFKQKIKDGIEFRNIKSYPNYQEYLDRIKYEFDTYKHNNAIDFMLLEENYKSEMRKKNIKFGYSRGSVSGSVIAYLLGITEIDSVKYKLNFERFMNKERVSLADIDTDWYAEDRKAVKEYLYNKKGLYCCDIVTFNTIALKGAIRDICRGLYKDIDFYSKLSKKWKKCYDEYQKSLKLNNTKLKMPEDLASEINKICSNDYLKISEEIIEMCELDEDKARKKYPEVFKYVDLVNGVIVSVGNHPAGCVISPFPVDEWFGTFSTSTDEYPISMLNMKEIDSLNFVKLDILCLDNIALIYKTCDLANIPFATPDNIPPDDLNVWKSIRENTTMIFQWESPSATSYLKQLLSDETIKKISEYNKSFSYMDLFSIGNGAIRPAGASYRERLAQGIYQDNGNEALNEFMKPTLGYCIEENQIINTLNGRKRIKDVSVGDVVYTQNGTSVVENKVFTGTKDTLLIKNDYGSIVCTKNHKIFTEKGWVNAENITTDNCIAVRVGNDNSELYDCKKLRMIGYLLGDGILNNHNNVSFVNKDINVINDFSNIVKTFDNCDVSISNRTSRVNHIDLYYVNVKHAIAKKTPTSVCKYLMDIGFKHHNGGKVAKDKFVPDFIFHLNTKCLLDFIGSYTDTDCCIKSKNKKIVSYKTSSKKLAYDIQEIIRLIGYVSRIFYLSSENAYAINVENAPKYLLDIYDYSFKVRSLYSIEELNNTIIRGGYVPYEYINKFFDNYKVSKKKIEKTTGLNLYSPKKYISINSLRKIHEKYDDIIPNYILNPNIIWCKINEIKDFKPSNVYDLTIKDEHNFTCQGIIVHNCVYQEQIMEFLHSFCGYTMGEADIVRRGFAKKTGTEKFIPKIKSGFTKTMMEKYNIPEKESGELIVNFIKVIQDASEYLFSKNHADPYSWIGYICGYLRYYYPLEFITTALNIFEGKEDKSLAIINYAKGLNIKISPIKFRHSVAKYNFNKETNEIYKGISSIKYMNESVANEIYDLRNNNYNTFVDMLYDLKDKTSINSKQLNILIKLNFFSEFGECNYLLKISEYFDLFCDKVQAKKEKIDLLKIPYDLVRKFSEKETEKTFTKLNSKDFLKELSNIVKVRPMTLKETIKAQIEHLGYIDIANEKYKGVLAIMSIDTKYSPRLQVYSLKNGTSLDVKIDKKTYNKNKVNKGDVIKVISQIKKPKMRKDENGDFAPIVGSNEIWLTKYSIINNI